jgi:hypothetical protein
MGGRKRTKWVGAFSHGLDLSGNVRNVSSRLFSNSGSIDDDRGPTAIWISPIGNKCGGASWWTATIPIDWRYDTNKLAAAD